MLVPGSLDSSGNWVEATSLGRSLDDAMVAAGVIDSKTDTPDAAKSRRKTLAALAQGFAGYITANMEINLAIGALRDVGETGAQLPSTDKTYTISGTQVTIQAGTILSANDTAIRVPLTMKSLIGQVA